jgi:hypothetical protein
MDMSNERTDAEDVGQEGDKDVGQEEGDDPDVVTDIGASICDTYIYIYIYIYISNTQTHTHTYTNLYRN